MVDGTPVASRDEVTALLAGTAPGDSITLVVEKDNTLIERTLTLSEWPDELATGDEISSGFMGVSYYDSERVVMVFENLASPEGMLYLLIAPLNIVPGAEFLRVIPYETVESTYLQVPLTGSGRLSISSSGLDGSISWLVSSMPSRCSPWMAAIFSGKD